MRGLSRMSTCEKSPLTPALSPNLFATTLQRKTTQSPQTNRGRGGKVALSNWDRSRNCVGRSHRSGFEQSVAGFPLLERTIHRSCEYDSGHALLSYFGITTSRAQDVIVSTQSKITRVSGLTAQFHEIPGTRNVKLMSRRSGRVLCVESERISGRTVSRLRRQIA